MFCITSVREARVGGPLCDLVVQIARQSRGHMDWLRNSICGLGNRMKLVKSIREVGGWHVKVGTKVGQCRER